MVSVARHASLALFLVSLSAATMVAQAPPRDTRTEVVERVARLSDLQPKTEEERQLSRQYEYGGAPMQPGVSSLRMSAPALPPRPPGAADPTREELLRDHVCGATALFLGYIESSRTIVTAGSSALVTVYRVRAEQWVRPSKDADVVIVGRYGGRVVVDGAEYVTPEQRPHEYPASGVRALMRLGRGRGMSAYYFMSDPTVVAPHGLSIGQLLSGPMDVVMAKLREVASANDCPSWPPTR